MTEIKFVYLVCNSVGNMKRKKQLNF